MDERKRRWQQFDIEKARELEHLLKQLERLLDALAEHPEQAELLDAQIRELQQTIRTVEKREFPG